jgi:2-polyprenyl-6-methoxyphenol hydroxylase-like FAD-dependent oxidoreductase
MYDVLIAGYGPTGMLAAILLGRAGHKVAVIERYKTLYNLPRVGIVHDDVLRMFQEIRIIDRVLPATYFLPTYEMGFHGEVLLSNDVAEMETHGWPEMTSVYQPAFEAELDATAKSLTGVDVFQGWNATGLQQNANGVEVTAEDGNGTSRTFEGKYLIGADGGNSFVRAALNVGYEDLGFDQAWLVIDGLQKRGRGNRPELRQFCEPEQPGMTMQMGPDHRRWSFMIFDDETPEEALKPENIWRRLDRPEGGTPEDFEIIRAVNYQFRSLIAERWQNGRVFLAGDSAHQMPPFLAQGMCSGFRDAHNIAWKLDLVLHGLAAPALLETYEAEREPIARATVIESMNVGQNVNERDPEKVRIRNEQLRALQKKMNETGEKSLIAFRVPALEAGFIGGNGGGVHVGQAKIATHNQEGRFDDLVGHGFVIIARNGDARAALDPDTHAFWAELGGKIVHFGNPDRGLKDVDGYFAGLMDRLGCDVIIKRPDYYAFDTCRTVADLPALLAVFRHRLTAPETQESAE